MEAHLIRQQLEKRLANLKKRRRILLAGMGQEGISDARKIHLLEKLNQTDDYILDDELSLSLGLILRPIHEQSKEATQDKTKEALQQGDMGAASRQNPNENVEMAKEAQGQLVKELKIDPQLAARIVKQLQSGDDEQIQKGLKQGDKALGKKDEKTDKMVKKFKAKVKEYIKLHKQMVAALKKLHQSDAGEVKDSMTAIRNGRMAAGLKGLKGISGKGGIQNDNAQAAQDLLGSLQGMSKLVGFNTDMIFRREFDKTANQPNFNASVGKTDSEARLDIDTNRADMTDKRTVEIIEGKKAPIEESKDEKKKKSTLPVGALISSSASR